MSSKRGFTFSSPTALSAVENMKCLSLYNIFHVHVMPRIWLPVQQMQKASFCLFLAILGGLKTEVQKEYCYCCNCNWANEDWYFRGQRGICLVYVVILIIFCWHVMVGSWAPKRQHVHVQHDWDLMIWALLSLCSTWKQEEFESEVLHGKFLVNELVSVSGIRPPRSLGDTWFLSLVASRALGMMERAEGCAQAGPCSGQDSHGPLLCLAAQPAWSSFGFLQVGPTLSCEHTDLLR